MSNHNEYMEDLTFKQNREISWLRFNERVLEETEDETVPLLEKMKFVEIYSSNLDEFFMIRVGSLYDKSIYTPDAIDNKSGMTPREQLQAIYESVHSLNHKYNDYFKKLQGKLRARGIYALEYDELEKSEKKYIKKYYDEMIYPILSPQIVDSHHPFPHLNNKSIYAASSLKSKTQDGSVFGIIPVPDELPEIINLPGQAFRYINTEKIVLAFLDDVFDMYEVKEKACISVTRNADLSFDDEGDDESYSEHMDFRLKMRELLHLRKRLAVVRLEVSHTLSDDFIQYLCDKFNIVEHQVFVQSVPFKLKYVYSLIDKITASENKELIYPDFSPVNRIDLRDDHVLEQVLKRDVILHYPYESMKPFLTLIRKAAYAPNVLSIKISIYRLAMKAALVDYLCAAAENGKDVTVLIELRARFDEQNNIDWSENLEDAGCKVIYGFEDYKVHSKTCLITYKDKGHIKYISQIGTGNYNEKTAEQYTDLSLMTSNQEIGEDVSEYFKNMSIGNLFGEYKHLLVAPNGLKRKILELMDEEIAKGETGRITVKINSLTDVDVINKLSEASRAGVQIKMIIRGICCILPGIEGKTDNIEIMSIVGRFLEHTRIYSFGTGQEQKLYISSADFMTRNLERRVEVACPIYDPEVKRELNEMLDIILSDNVKARVLNPSGIYHKKEDGKEPFISQEAFIRQAIEKNKNRVVVKETFWTRMVKAIKRAFS